MGYRHIENLYKNQDILLFKECYALEKIHGTSTHIAYRKGQVSFASGGASHNAFTKLFNEETLKTAFEELGHTDITIYGEAYGGSQQGQAYRYGKELKFIAFDVLIMTPTPGLSHLAGVGEWLEVPVAEKLVSKLGLEFVPYQKVSTDLFVLNYERDAQSIQATRNGIETFQHREGVVLRPIKEVCLQGGERIMCKHKRDEEKETRTSREVGDPAKLAVLEAAGAIAFEWVTDTRLQHVLDKLPPNIGMEGMQSIIAAMVEDVLREGKDEIVDSKPARAAIGKRTAQLFKELLNNRIGA